MCFHIIIFSGTNVDEAKSVLADSGLPVTSAVDLQDAAEKAVTSLFHDERESGD